METSRILGRSRMKKTTIFVALMACLMVAGTANADLIDYVFTVDGDVIGGTLTYDTVAEEVTAYSFYRDGSPGVFDTSDGGAVVLGLDGGGEPLTLFMDIDDSVTGDFIFADPGFNFSTGAGFYEPEAVTVTGAALTPVPEPATMSLLAIGGLALLRRRKRA
jgi:hypothetical protein